MKKTAILAFVAVLTFSMAACSNTNPQAAPSDESILKPDEAFAESEKSTGKETEERENHSVTSQYEIGDMILEASSEDDYAWFVHYFNGYAGECPKNFTNVHALAVRAF